MRQAVSDSQIAGVCEEGISYIVAEEREIDLAAVLDALNHELEKGRLLLEGSGAANGALLQAGVVDELSVITAPSAEGVLERPAIFDIYGEQSGLTAMGMLLESCPSTPTPTIGRAIVPTAGERTMPPTDQHFRR